MRRQLSQERLAGKWDRGTDRVPSGRKKVGNEESEREPGGGAQLRKKDVLRSMFVTQGEGSKEEGDTEDESWRWVT